MVQGGCPRRTRLHSRSGPHQSQNLVSGVGDQPVRGKGFLHDISYYVCLFEGKGRSQGEGGKVLSFKL